MYLLLALSESQFFAYTLNRTKLISNKYQKALAVKKEKI